MEVMAVGQLVFRLKREEFRLTAIGRRLAVWFKDPTNSSTTYRGYGVVRPQVGAAAVGPGGLVEDGTWTVLDFNSSSNPPCAYSFFTTCPLPPSENRLRVHDDRYAGRGRKHRPQPVALHWQRISRCLLLFRIF